jgi:hypothetical protein
VNKSLVSLEKDEMGEKIWEYIVSKDWSGIIQLCTSNRRSNHCVVVVTDDSIEFKFWDNTVNKKCFMIWIDLEISNSVCQMSEQIIVNSR